MPELPDLYVLARSMDQALRGRRIESVDVHQPRCLNLAPAALSQAVLGATMTSARQRGKWALLELDSLDLLAINLGMGGEVCLHRPDELADPGRERVVFRLDDGRQLWVHFWWFGQVHVVPGGDLSAHPHLARLGPEPLADDFTTERLAALLHGRRGALKKYLLDQSFIAGIGNVYVQDILWRARLHPLVAANALSAEDVARLHEAIRQVLLEGIRWGGGPGEKDVWGNEGRYAEHLQVGYRTGQPCPACGTLVEQLRVGPTTSYICPACQRAP
ncbi:MAG: bifunctional DNA-formamidopyrimidine glycosylase/DNA-(apurinic or apyrimidinic site) lyase [Anaerolineae bacterium]|nr:bifunctional DNA-formamidopyrimidine glycosylase/DNA-(apurinic or apyrimidinic site) lyase [Anaerolineae bacterium]